jgi:hypothetical protein
VPTNAVATPCLARDMSIFAWTDALSLQLHSAPSHHICSSYPSFWVTGYDPASFLSSLTKGRIVSEYNALCDATWGGVPRPYRRRLTAYTGKLCSATNSCFGNMRL